MEQACELALAEVHDNPLQPRLAMNDEVVAGARVAIENAGGRYPVSMAITVRPREAGGYEIIAGHHRTRAAREAGVATIWAYVELLDDRAAALALAATNNQAEMTPLEHARHAIWLMENHAVSMAEYARLVGRNEATISRAVQAYRVIADHGGPTGPNAAVSIGALAALSRVADPAQRAALIYQFRTRRTTEGQATEVLAHLRAGVPMRDAFRRAEAPADEKPAALPGARTGSSGTQAQSSDANAVAAARLNSELIDSYEWTLALYQARSEELEKLVGDLKGPAKEAFLTNVAARHRQLVAELKKDKDRLLKKPGSGTAQPACGTCEHGRASAFEKIGFKCAVGRLDQCLPLTERRCWVEREESEASA